MSGLSSISTRALAATALASGGGAALLWGKILSDAWPTLFLQGTICGRTEGFLAHCPLCLPAAVLTGIALAAVFTLIQSRQRRAPCKC